MDLEKPIFLSHFNKPLVKHIMPVKSGHIELILGPMFAGKSTELLRLVRRYKVARKNVLIIKYKGDTRYSKNKFSTHDKQQLSAVSAMKLSSVDCDGYDVIGIDEGQFFPDIVEFSEELANAGKIVIIAALDGTFQRKPFGRILELVPKAEEITKLKSVCSVCFESAAFSKKIAGDKSQIKETGGADLYIAVCRRCYFEDGEEKKNSSESV